MGRVISAWHLCFAFFFLFTSFFFIHGRPNSGSAGRARTRDSFYRKSIPNHTEEGNNNESQIREENKEKKRKHQTAMDRSPKGSSH